MGNFNFNVGREQGPGTMSSEIVYGARSSREAKDWICSVCAYKNKTVRKLVFNVPAWRCGGVITGANGTENCQRKFLDDNHELDFCLGDVRINGRKLIYRLFDQMRDEANGTCVQNALCQTMQISYMLQCIVKNKSPETKMMHLEPNLLVRWFDRCYPERGSTTPFFGDTFCRIKTLLKLRHEGMPHEDNSPPYKIGDITCIDLNNYEAICEELANGVPLFATIMIGSSFVEMGYCLIYKSPEISHILDCNLANKNNTLHEKHLLHSVVLLGPASNGSLRGFYFVNSWGLWCPRFMLDKSNEVTETKKHGIAKVSNLALFENPVKLWLPGERGARSKSFREENEILRPELRLANLAINVDLLERSCQQG